jgi:peptidoglycan/LPS O-acetylase OafA/YrhL
VVAVITGIAYVVYFYGENYNTDACLQHPFTNFYAWIMILAILGCAKAWFDYSNPFTKYMSSRSFLIYILHYPCLVAIAYFIVTYLNLPLILNYVVILILTLIIVPCVCEVVLRIPIKNRRKK